MKKTILLFTLSIVTFKAVCQNWSKVGFSYDNSPSVYLPCSMDIDTSGHIYVVNTANYFYEWNGFSWTSSPSGPYITPAKCIKHVGTATYLAGDYVNSSGTLIIAKWANNAWSTIPSPSSALGGKITSLDADQSGNLYAVGEILNNSNQPYVAKWNGTSWSQVGGTSTFATTSGNYPNLVKVNTNGDVYVAGGIKDANGYYYVAKWNGNIWSKLGTGMNFADDIYAINVDASGNVYVAGGLHSGNAYYVAKCSSNGVWSMFGSALSQGPGNICVRGNNVYVDGTNTSGLQTVYQSNGSSWTELGNGFSTPNQFPIQRMAMDNTGTLYAAGSFGYVNKISTTLSIPEIANKANFHISPYGGHDLYSFHGNGFNGDKVNIEIYDQIGQGVKKLQLALRNGSMNEIVDLTNLQSGVYIVRIIDSTQMYSLKLEKI